MSTPVLSIHGKVFNYKLAEKCTELGVELEVISYAPLNSGIMLTFNRTADVTLNNTIHLDGTGTMQLQQGHQFTEKPSQLEVGFSAGQRGLSLLKVVGETKNTLSVSSLGLAFCFGERAALDKLSRVLLHESAEAEEADAEAQWRVDEAKRLGELVNELNHDVITCGYTAGRSNVLLTPEFQGTLGHTVANTAAFPATLTVPGQGQVTNAVNWTAPAAPAPAAAEPKAPAPARRNGRFFPNLRRLLAPLVTP
jgi:hypothetical protein